MSEQAEDIALEEDPGGQGEGEGGGLSIEERAQAVGWNADGPLSAEDFIAKRDEHNGLLKNDIRKLEDQLGQTTNQMSIMSKMLQKQTETARQQGYDQALADIKAEKAAAITEGDADKFAEAEAKEDALRDEQRKEQTEGPRQEAMQQLANSIRQHQTQYPEVFDTHEKAQDWQNEFRYQVTQQKLSINDAMNKATQVVAKKHGDSKPVPGATEGGDRSAGSGGKRDFAAMPADAKAAYETYKQNNPALDKEQFANDYWEQFGDE